MINYCKFCIQKGFHAGRVILISYSRILHRLNYRFSKLTNNSLHLQLTELLSSSNNFYQIRKEIGARLVSFFYYYLSSSLIKLKNDTN